MSTATQKVFLPAIFTCSHITFAMVYSFYFLCFDPRRNEFNLLFVKESTYSSGRYIFRANRSLLISPPLLSPKDYWIYPFRSQNTEKRNNVISQMRLRSGFKMRISILNPATTEQMGYGIISFFVCFLFNKSNELHHYQGLRFLFHLFGFLLHFLHHKGRSYHRRTRQCKVLSLRLLQLIPVVL